MTQLQFMLTDYTVKLGSEQISLLRKEYYLLQYLYEHANQAFSREQLLNAVWPLEAPSERTVDDHIYRLRKKLKRWDGELTIETIKGFGYQLVCEKPHHKVLPVMKDQEFRQLLESVLKKYHLYGQGDSIAAFISEKNIGFEIPAAYEIILAYMKGDFWWFIRENKYPMTDKLFFLIHIFQTLSKDYTRSIMYIQHGIKRDVFPKHHRYEAETIGLLLAYTANREFEKATQYVDDFINQRTPEITKPDHGFYPFLQNIRLLIAIGRERFDEFAEICAQMERFYLEKPYQRELGIFTIIKGACQVRNHEAEQGIAEIERGFDIVKRTHFKSHLFPALDMAMLLLAPDFSNTIVYEKLKERREQLEQEYHPAELLSQVRAILDQYLA
ncbi:winged helix-turn-helix domain-containing protein [Pseudobacillus badius]|uniref:winged helix-turn-helix domain-containing protein n=1 Tax=Bacillus badius TaxID=1455 RepID=UPI001CBBCB36|nr:winged helix-turn-helix domain-containing protein [Bacillus badius]UAT30911.1 winged helix-turn-helix domain-containing protein [Bacillus badius]GLY11653.1 hypothetical protein Bbad01_28690 [Bacillus badius]